MNVLPNPASILPEIMGLREEADKLSGQLGGLERWLRIIAEHVEPQEVEYSNSTSNSYESSRIVKAGNGRLFGLSGYNSKSSAQFILGFDRTTLPSNGAVPAFVMTALATDNFWVSWAPNWRNFTDGWVFTNSSTAQTLTLGSADCWFDAQYL